MVFIQDIVFLLRKEILKIMPQHVFNVPVGPSPDQPSQRYCTNRRITECSLFIHVPWPAARYFIRGNEVCCTFSWPYCVTAWRPMFCPVIQILSKWRACELNNVRVFDISPLALQLNWVIRRVRTVFNTIVVRAYKIFNFYSTFANKTRSFCTTITRFINCEQRHPVHITTTQCWLRTSRDTTMATSHSELQPLWVWKCLVPRVMSKTQKRNS
jgi:hypothetical protein